MKEVEPDIRLTDAMVGGTGATAPTAWWPWSTYFSFKKGRTRDILGIYMKNWDISEISILIE